MKVLYVDVAAFNELPDGVLPALIVQHQRAYQPFKTVELSTDPRQRKGQAMALATSGKHSPGRLLTSVNERQFWSVIDEDVEIHPWNGVALSRISPEIWILYLQDLTIARARVLAKRWADRERWNKDEGVFKAAMKELMGLPQLDLSIEPPPHMYILGVDAYVPSPDIVVAFDLETTGLDPYNDKIVGISFSGSAGTAGYVPISGGFPPGVLALLGDPDIRKIGHNLKFDLKFLLSRGISVRGIIADTQLMAYILQKPKRGLKDLAEAELRIPVLRFEDVVRGRTFDQVPIEDQVEYAGQDADLTLQLFYRLGNQMTEEQQRLLREIEMPLVPILARMELTGAPVDPEAAAEMVRRTEEELASIETVMWEWAGQEFNPESPQDLAWLLFQKLGLEPLRETKTGVSTDKYTLEQYADVPMVQMILGWRTRQKLLSTYLRPMAESPDTRVYGQFNQMVTTTGRLSSSEPNLQNQPAAVRHLYRVSSPIMLVAADYAQQELRLLAHMSQDPRLLEAFRLGEDIHQQTAELLGVPRRLAKNVNFAIPYGGGAVAVSRQAKCSVEEAGQLMAAHREKYPRLWQWVDETKQFAREHGYAETLWGRRRLLPYIHEPGERQAAAEREAVNMPIQGSAADLIKIAMTRLDDRLRGSTARMILQVHDELVFEVLDPRELPGVELVVREVMETADDGILTVPLVVDIHRGSSWAELK